jgi:anti-sigma B factor antagonist
MSLDLSSSTQGDWKVIHVSGIVDTKTVNELRDFLDGQVTGSSPVALELAGVPFMSSAGLRTLLTLYRKTKSLGLSLALVGLQSTVEEVMKVTGFYQHFTIFSTLTDLPQGNAK